MSEFEKAKQNGKKDISQDVITDIDTEIEKELPPVQPGLGKRVRQALKNMQQGGPAPRQELAKDRTRSFALLIGGTVGAVLLFIGVFSTPTPPPETSERSDSPKPRKRSGTRSANGGTKLGHAARSGRVELDRNFLDLTPNGRGDWYAKLDYVSHFRKSISREEKSPDAQAYSQMQCSLDGYVSGPAGELDWIFPDFDAEYADWGVERRALFEPDPQRHERVLQCL